MKSVWFWVILGVGLAARTALYSAAIQDDRRASVTGCDGYSELAWSMAHWGQFLQTSLEDVGTVSLAPEICLTPGYPGLLAGAELLLGRAFREPKAWWATLALQVFLDLHVVLLTYWLGREILGHGVGLLAAFFHAISPVAVAATCRQVPDGLFAFFLTAAVLLIVRHLRTGSWRTLLPAAAVMGVACYVEPMGLVFSGLMAMVLLFRPRRWRRVAAFAGVLAACIAPWVARNAVTADYVGFSSFATDGMYWHAAAEVVARRQGVSAEEARQRFRREEGWDSFDPDLMGQPGLSNAPCYRTPGGLARYRRQRAEEILAAHPWTYLGIHLRGCLAFWLPGAGQVLKVAGHAAGEEETLTVLRERGLAAAAWLAGGMVLVLLVRYAGVVLCGLWRLRRGMSAAAWLMVLLVAASFLLPGPAAGPRSRVPVAPILSVAAAVGWIGLIERLRRRGARREES